MRLIVIMILIDFLPSWLPIRMIFINFIFFSMWKTIFSLVGDLAVTVWFVCFVEVVKAKFVWSVCRGWRKIYVFVRWDIREHLCYLYKHGHGNKSFFLCELIEISKLIKLYKIKLILEEWPFVGGVYFFRFSIVQGKNGREGWEVKNSLTFGKNNKLINKLLFLYFHIRM